MPDEPSLHAARLRLVALRADVLRSLLEGNVAKAGELQGFSFPQTFLDSVNNAFLEIQLRTIEHTLPGQDWCVRAIVLEHDGAVIGHCGFHGPPETVGRAEIGYQIFPDFRNRGYATEAVGGLVDLAKRNGATVLFAAVSPSNVSSIRVVEKVGFEKTGVQGSTPDEEELVFELHL